MTVLAELRAVDHVYPDGSPGLSACSLRLQAGRRHALLGANGAGKTTLLHHLNGLLRPSAGTLSWRGAALDYSRAGLATLRRHVGLVFQNPERQLLSANVAEDVSFGPLNLGLDEATVRRRVAGALDAVGMADYAERPVHHLSFGQKKRVCIAGVLAMEPELLLLDEPMAGLDTPMQAGLEQLLCELAARGVTIAVSTHDIDFAWRWADEFHLMAAGHCIGSGPAAALATRTDLLHAAGQRPPLALSLHGALAARGLLPHDPLPRSVDAVLRSLELETA